VARLVFKSRGKRELTFVNFASFASLTPKLELEAEAEPVSGFQIPFHGMDDLGKKEQKICAERDIRVLVPQIPGKLNTGSTVKSKDDNFVRKNIKRSGLKFQVADRVDVVQVSRHVDVAKKRLLQAHTLGLLEAGDREITV
jgi:hypothetical protein